MKYELFPLGEDAVLIELSQQIDIETHEKVQLVTNYLDGHPPEWMIEYIPAFTTVTIYYDPFKIATTIPFDQMPYTYVCQQIDSLFAHFTDRLKEQRRIVEIPVCYGGELGPDLEMVAKVNQLTPEEVIDIHTSGQYIVYMIGFAPGFPYIGGMSEKIATPRKESPRLAIPERSVGIAGMQTGIYPIETPGGWQLIGRTPKQLFTPETNPPSLLKAGDQIKFTSISLEEYQELEKRFV
ncbi:5-oxoprolinase subunit PxpB [Gracilibacillus sp. S3-1-1]|uniref:5-oxoprolinase subunit PxpB n=1 Tax=Gracilibacillus pellucidus TaxID=3095368 RepID=A0ACC6M9M5_9BACI|nr:5-oxoprolinase subunit PxpB [Gracilibacillus sp. S3-1-1]MDX8047583.1 5-oxoprolinase subunit PxpB [Gracilibacillus sp. S3-1-1]